MLLINVSEKADLVIQYPVVVMTALLNVLMVVFKNSHVVKVRERSWSWFNTEKSTVT